MFILTLLQLIIFSGMQANSKAEQLGLTNQCFFLQKMSDQAKKAINEAKIRDRPSMSLNDWNKCCFHQNNTIQVLFECPDQIDRQDVVNFTEDEFTEKYHKIKKPVIIKGCNRNWKSSEYWKHNYLAEKFMNYRFKIGEDDDGQKIRVTMKTFLEYLIHNTDDSPLYLFENTNIVDEEIAAIIANYSVPTYFQQDIFNLLEQDLRPPYRWFLMGPQRSGSRIHIDPLMTSAWNTSLAGHKRWVIFSPNVPKQIAKGKQFRRKDYTDQSINYFIEILPQIKAKYSREELGLYEFIQYPGETVFVPGGAWHAVVNLDNTIAVTQNFMNRANFDEVWKAINAQRKYLVPILLEKIKGIDFKLYEHAIVLNNMEQDCILSISQSFKNHQKQHVMEKKSSQDDLKSEEHKEEFNEFPEKRQRRLSEHNETVKYLSAKTKTFSLRDSSGQCQTNGLAEDFFI